MQKANRKEEYAKPLPEHIQYEPVSAPLTAPVLLPTSSKILPAQKRYPMSNQLYMGDAVSTLQLWPDGCFDACITDPPYNIAKKRKGLKWAFSSHVTIDSEWDRFSNDEYQRFTFDWLKEICRVTKVNGNIFIFGSYHNIYTIGHLAACLDLRVVNSIIWAKPNAQPNITCRMFTESTEQILWLCNNTNDKAKNWTFNYHHMKELNGGKQMRNYWEIPLTPPKERIHGKHPSQKPIRLMERLVLAGTRAGDNVVDCFVGSGSTLLALDRLGRNWVGIEKDPEYCQIAHARLDEERKQRRLFAQTLE
jgi:site-specific DNA-methyltransferase (adenine-specific)